MTFHTSLQFQAIILTHRRPGTGYFYTRFLYCHHQHRHVSEWDFGRDARQVCQAERSLKSPLARTK